MRRPVFWQIPGTSGERSPLISKSSLRLDVCSGVVFSVSGITASLAIVHYFLTPDKLLRPFQRSVGRSAGHQARLESLSSKSVDIDLIECSIPPVVSRNWTQWLDDYEPPSCPKVDQPWSASLNADTVHSSSGTVRFDILPRTTIIPASRLKPSIAIIFIDAISRAAFFRSFPTSAAALQTRMAKNEAFTFGGLAASDRFTPPNAAMVLAGIDCSDGVLTGFVYQNVCELLAEYAPGDVTLWEIAKRHGMVTSAAIDDWNGLPYLHRGEWDHEFHVSNVTGVHDHKTPYGNLRCFGGCEVSNAQLEHTKAVHQAYDSSGARILSFTYLTSLHQPDTRHGRVVDEQLSKTLAAFAALETPTAVLVFGDHGNQYAREEDEQSERYLPLGIFVPPHSSPPSWAKNLRSNQFAITSMADLHKTLLHRIDPAAQPLHASWPYKGMLMWPIHSLDLATDRAAVRTPSALGIQKRHHPCASPWIPLRSADIDNQELQSAAEYLVQKINDMAGVGRFGSSQCRPLRLLSVSSGKLYTREPFQLKLTINVETQREEGLPQHNATYAGSVHRFWGFCRGYMRSACLFGDMLPWSLDEAEPISTYSQYEGCMGSIANSWRKRFCICDGA